MQTKNALSNLKNRYMAVLKKCTLINVFGTLALATFLAAPALTHAALINPLDTTIPYLDASNEVPDANNTIFATNNGTINEGKDYRDSAYFWSFSGLFAYSYETRNIVLNNYGDITISSDAARVHAMDAYTEKGGNFQLFNAGSLTVSSKNQDAYAMSAYTLGMGNHSLVNKGIIKVNSEDVLGGTDARAFGMSAYSEKDGSHKLENYNSIEVSAIGHNAYGMYARTDDNGSHELFNSGNIKVDVVADSRYTKARGMVAEAYLDGDHKITNKGDINVTLKGTPNGITYATGIYAEAWHGDMNITNDGSIIAKNYADSGKAQGIAMDEETNGNHTVINNNYIEVYSEDSYSDGIYLEVDGDHTVINNGTIKASSNGDQVASGISVIAVGQQDIKNTGIIQVENVNDAYGIVLNSSSINNTINNTGIISAKSSKADAFEVYAYNSYLVDTYATTLRNWSDNDAVFALSSGSVTFDNSTLILRPGTIEEGFVYGKQYNVANMVVINNIQQDEFIAGEINGSIVSVKTEVPFLTAHLDNTDLTKPQVSLSTNVNSDTVTPTQYATIKAGNFQKEVTNLASNKIRRKINKRMANKVQTVSENAYKQGLILASNEVYTAPTYAHPWEIYLDAYTSYTGNSEYGYGTHAHGMTLGGEKTISDTLALGFALNFSDSSTDGQDGLLADSTDITLAVNADYNINPDWYVSGTMALSYGDNDMDYTLSPVLHATDDYSSSTFYMAVNTGYVYEVNENNIIVPEFGLSYLHSSTDSINLDFAASDVYDMRISSDDFSALYATLMLTWQGQYDFDFGTLTPSAALGIRQNLTGSDFDSSVSVLGGTFDTVASEDDTTFLFNTGLEWNKENFSLGIYYDGAYGSQQSSHSANVKFKLEF